jgi:hypothetical protein
VRCAKEDVQSIEEDELVVRRRDSVIGLRDHESYVPGNTKQSIFGSSPLVLSPMASTRYSKSNVNFTVAVTDSFDSVVQPKLTRVFHRDEVLCASWSSTPSTGPEFVLRPVRTEPCVNHALAQPMYSMFIIYFSQGHFPSLLDN